MADPQRTEWLRRKGLLTPSEAAFLKSLHQMGVVEHSLVVPRSAAHPNAEIAAPLTAAQALFDLAALRPTALKRLDVRAGAAADIAAAMRSQDGALSVVAIHAREEGGFSVVEGSHVVAAPAGSLEGAIDYSFGPDRLLFLDLGARFERLDGPPADLNVFVACI